ncbi:hypothetical protein [Methylovulum psychrotolerans]|uniref:Uncharacterized protein n=1 Tax=Methylovulum psychrotolerans TaxID=1704499 RepID=A0A1Z4C3W1_9GAMM|nr:hypothetical protein [Methylovulum psychrotolerans]ASF48200.1 hypothetical protein CEK71_20230 [Methylovulum psychrotolerans]
MATRDKEVLDAMLGKIYMILNGGDTVNTVHQPNDTFVSYTTLGIALSNEDLSFGFSTSSKEISAASNFADLVNSIPKCRGFWDPSSDKIWDIYNKILTLSILAPGSLTQEEERQLKACLDSLYTTTTVVDPDTGESKQMPMETPLYTRYKKGRGAYEAALMAYNNLLINVKTNPNNPSVVIDWNLNGPLYKQRAMSAYDDWIANGKNIVEKALGKIDILTGRSPERLWQELKTRFNQSKRLDLQGQDYWHTAMFPSDFYTSAYDDSWTKFTFSGEEVHTVDTSTSTSWGGGGSIGYGLWSFGASATYGSQTSSHHSDASNMSLSLELMKIPLRRSWLDTSMLKTRIWKFDPAYNLGDLSDGAVPPNGLMVGIPAAIIVARNLKITMSMSTVDDTYAASQFSTSATVGWGPFSLRGNYSRSTSKNTHDFSSSNGVIECPGKQIIGFTVELFPKCPNPNF